MMRHLSSQLMTTWQSFRETLGMIQRTSIWSIFGRYLTPFIWVQQEVRWFASSFKLSMLLSATRTRVRSMLNWSQWSIMRSPMHRIMASYCANSWLWVNLSLFLSSCKAALTSTSKTAWLSDLSKESVISRSVFHHWCFLMTSTMKFLTKLC